MKTLSYKQIAIELGLPLLHVLFVFSYLSKTPQDDSCKVQLCKASRIVQTRESPLLQGRNLLRRSIAARTGQKFIKSLNRSASAFQQDIGDNTVLLFSSFQYQNTSPANIFTQEYILEAVHGDQTRRSLPKAGRASDHRQICHDPSVHPSFFSPWHGSHSIIK
jgi:hypothetical protein